MTLKIDGWPCPGRLTNEKIINFRLILVKFGQDDATFDFFSESRSSISRRSNCKYTTKIRKKGTVIE